MNNTDIIAFSEIVKQGSFSKAAEKLFVTQSALSLRIRNLEEELNCKLFYRKKGVRYTELTVAGKEFLTLVERWNSLWFEMINIKSETSNLSFKLSSINSISAALLPQVLFSFINKNKKVFLKTEDFSSYASYDAMENNSINLALIVDQRYSLDIECNPLFSEKMVFVSGKPSTLPQHVTFEDLSLEKFIFIPWFLKYEQWCQSAFGKGFTPLIQIEVMHQLSFLLNNKDCFSIVPLSVANMFAKDFYINLHSYEGEIPDRYVFYLSKINDRDEHNLKREMLQCLKDELLLLQDTGILTCHI